MLKKNFIPIKECLERISQKYELEEKDIKRIKSLKNYEISSISITTEGGFDPLNAFFYSGERAIDYKVRITYHKPQNSKKLFLMLVAVKNE